MLWLVLATLTVGWAGDPVNTLSPAYAEMFGRGEAFIGLQVAAFGTGSAIASLGVRMVRVRFGSVETTKTGIALLAVGLIGFALAPSEVVVLVALFVAGVGFLFAVTTTNSNLQRRLDESMRGRVMALWSMAFLGSRPIAGIIDGAVGDLVSPRVGVLTAAIPLLVGWWAMSRVEPHDGPRARRAAGSPEAESGR